MSLRALADGIHLSLAHDDIPRAMHLSWLLMMQPQCPLQLQAHAVLVHSAASLTLGGDPEVIETNTLHAMIKRLGNALSKLQMHGEEPAPWNVKALGQLRAALSTLRNSRKANLFRSRASKPHLGDLDSLIEGFGQMGLGCIREEAAGFDGRSGSNTWHGGLV
ncbi:hypothetical protein K439DRAFT_1615731 [Ramaria rubella]|nr:hypothetical protein K439DRAFT_1615731 [Ramaria rubella]